MAGEILYDKLNPNDVAQQALRDDRSRPVDQHKYLAPGNALKSTRTINNVFNLVPGAYPAPTVTYPGTIIQGTAGTTMPGMTVNDQVIVRDVRFTGPITIGVNGRAVFDRCHFEAATTVASGGKASFNGSSFAEPVTNGGAVANVAIMGCLRTGSPHVNVTIIWEG